MGEDYFEYRLMFEKMEKNKREYYVAKLGESLNIPLIDKSIKLNNNFLEVYLYCVLQDEKILDNPCIYFHYMKIFNRDCLVFDYALKSDEERNLVMVVYENDLNWVSAPLKQLDSAIDNEEYDYLSGGVPKPLGHEYFFQCMVLKNYIDKLKALLNEGYLKEYEQEILKVPELIKKVNLMQKQIKSSIKKSNKPEIPKEPKKNFLVLLREKLKK